jgi:o-succinylbenzoate---CoA ligase
MHLVSHGSYAKRVNELVCLDLPLGDAFINRLKSAWDAGDAIFPLDQRLPSAARAEVLRVIQPTVITDSSGDTRAQGEKVADGDAVVIATSGTTGIAKGVVLTHHAIQASAKATSARLGITKDDCWFACLPPSHIGGLSVVLRSIIMGTKFITAPSFTVEAYNDAASKGATVVSLVSTAMQQVDTSLYRTIVLGGAKAPIHRPSNSVVTYGLTESGSGVVYNGLPLDEVNIEIRDGIIFLRAPMLLRSYRDGTTPLVNGWLHTGDHGYIAADGLLHVEGREGDLIVTGGENVWPEQVETRLSAMTEVRDVCVAGVPDNKWGHAVHAFVVLNTDMKLSIEEVREWVKETLPAYSAPQALHVVDEIPRTALGKPQRHILVASVTN